MRLLLVLSLLYVQGFAQTSSPLPPAPPQPLYSDPQRPEQAATCDVLKFRRNEFGLFDFCTPGKKASSPAPGAGTQGNVAVPAPSKPATRILVCSIPLLNVAAIEAHDDRMVVSVPLKESRDVVVVAPAPPCHDKKK